MIETLWRAVRTMSMNRLKKFCLNVAIVTIASFSMSGCSALQETMASQMEVPTLEKQANRVATGMAIVKENNIIENKLPISADAKWPKLITADLTDEQKKAIDEALMRDPYFATVHFTDHIQRKMLGSGALLDSLGDSGQVFGHLANQVVSPLDYIAFHKIDIFYANPALKSLEKYPSKAMYIKEKTKYWPDVYKFNTNLSSILEFEGGKLREIDSPTGDVYDNLHKAVIALAPVNLQKDIELAQNEYQEATQNAAMLEGEKGALENMLQTGKESDGKQKLSEKKKSRMSKELVVKEDELNVAKADADEKEKIYFELLNQMAIALESDVNVDDEKYVKLATNINIVANELQQSSNEAYTAFGLALAQITANGALTNFVKEIESLAIGKAFVPLNLQAKYNMRLIRVVKNALAILPNIGMGTYYAYKQASVGGKYEEITEKILDVYNIKKEQEAAKAETQEE